MFFVGYVRCHLVQIVYVVCISRNFVWNDIKEVDILWAIKPMGVSFKKCPRLKNDVIVSWYIIMRYIVLFYVLKSK